MFSPESRQEELEGIHSAHVRAVVSAIRHMLLEPPKCCDEESHRIAPHDDSDYRAIDNVMWSIAYMAMRESEKFAQILLAMIARPEEGLKQTEAVELVRSQVMVEAMRTVIITYVLDRLNHPDLPATTRLKRTSELAVMLAKDELPKSFDHRPV